MMNARRSLFVIGCLMAALVAFAPNAVFAQAAATAEFEADSRGHDTIRLTWEHPGTNLDKFSLRYQEGTCVGDPCEETDFDLTMNVMRMDVAKKSSGDDYEISIDDLKPGTSYKFGLTALGSGTETDADEVFAGEVTDSADEPDDVRNLMLTAGDGMIMAMWEETTDNGSPVTGYQVQYKMSDEADSKYMTSREGTMENTSTEWTISNLKNDMEYTVRVRACSFTACGDWSDEEDAMPMAGAAMPTPALPLFGAFALGAGLLAAGRARLRRRERR
jgi:hypothetical protein